MIKISSDFDWNVDTDIPEDYYDNPNIEILKNYHLPVFYDCANFLKALCISVNTAKKFFYPKCRGNFLYRNYRMPKKKGGYREISVPCIDLKNVQRAVNTVILSRFKMTKWCTGFKRNVSLLNNAQPHFGAKTLIKMDIKDFFGTITFGQVYKQFKCYGYGDKVAEMLTLICVDGNDRLPQGAPTSPALSNLVCIRLDERIGSYCEKRNYVYTRYADDITISSKEKLSKDVVTDVKKFVRYIIENEGFTVNSDKTHVFYEGQNMTITGVRINNGIAKPSKKILTELNNAIYFIGNHGLEYHLNNIKCQKQNYADHLFGLASYVYMINKELGVKYFSELNRVLGEKK